MIGHRIKQLRESKNMKRFDLAERLSIDESTLGKIENNQVKISAERLIKVATALDTGINEFFVGLPSKNFNPDYVNQTRLKQLLDHYEEQIRFQKSQAALLQELLEKTNRVLDQLDKLKPS